MFELLKKPALRAWLQEDWSRANLAIEEFLRFVSPVQVSSGAPGLPAGSHVGAIPLAGVRRFF